MKDQQKKKEEAKKAMQSSANRAPNPQPSCPPTPNSQLPTPNQDHPPNPNQSSPEDEFHFRKEKLNKIREQEDIPYKSLFKRTHRISDAFKLKPRDHEEIINNPTPEPVLIRGRLKSFRSHGNLSFANLEDMSGSIQVAFMKNALGKEKYQSLKNVDVADFISVTGEIFITKKGETSILALDYALLSKTLRPLPEKFHGIQDQEKKYRQRYLDLASNKSTREKFIFRSKVISFLRRFLEDRNFLEVETPILSKTASGALAKPFLTHHNALDAEFFLRIALETPQKKLLGGGLEKVFEIGKVFRNEGMDPSHLQEFTLLEFYEAYADFNHLKKITEDLFQKLTKDLTGSSTVEIIDHRGELIQVDFTPPYTEISLRDIIKRDSSIDYEDHPELKSLVTAVKSNKIDIKNIDQLSRGNLIDSIYKKTSRHKVIKPTFITNHPVDLSPLARKSDLDPKSCDRFQLVIGGWEIVNAYSELVDPIDQRERFESQSQARSRGDEEAHDIDDDFVLAMEHGFPPCAGWGMGVDRLVALLTKSENLRDVVLFPLMK